ncbi:MAG: response regulator [Anaerolineae bacterium]|nr:response regulator [Anaerolineae bacterium]
MASKRILVVDDERLTRISLADFLREAGYETVAASNGQTALQLQQEHSFDVCIVDIRMPGPDGVETILALHRVAPGTRFIIYTGSLQFTLPLSLEELGLSEGHIVRKPVLDMQIFVTFIEQTSLNK